MSEVAFIGTLSEVGERALEVANESSRISWEGCPLALHRSECIEGLCQGHEARWIRGVQGQLVEALSGRTAGLLAFRHGGDDVRVQQVIVKSSDTHPSITFISAITVERRLDECIYRVYVGRF